MNDPTISNNGGDRRADPEIAEPICIYHKGIKSFRSRALLGWRHQTDTAKGRREGKIWCWVTEDGARFQVYDEHFNRSERAGVPRFCGVANFTMIRMFHPFWARNGQPPRDMRSSDKEWCRDRYNALMRRHEEAQNLSSDESSDSDDDRRKRRRAPKRSTGRKLVKTKAKKDRAAEKRRARVSRSSSTNSDRFIFPDSHSDTESDTSERPITSNKRQKRQAGSGDSDTDESLNSLARTRDVSVKAETQNTQTVPTGPTENYGGITVEALPALPILPPLITSPTWKWKFKLGETIDLEAITEGGSGNGESGVDIDAASANDNGDDSHRNDQDSGVGDKDDQINEADQERHGEDSSSDDSEED